MERTHFYKLQEILKLISQFKIQSREEDCVGDEKLGYIS